MTGRRSIRLTGAGGISTAGSLGILVTLAAVIAATSFSPSSLPKVGSGPSAGEDAIGLPPSESEGGSPRSGLDGAAAFLAARGTAAGGAPAAGAGPGSGAGAGSAAGAGSPPDSSRAGDGSRGGGRSGGSGGGGGGETRATTRRPPGNADPQGSARGHLWGPKAPPGHGGTPPGQATAPSRSAKPPPPTSQRPSASARPRAAKPRKPGRSQARSRPAGQAKKR